VGRGLAAVSAVRASSSSTDREKGETYHDVGGLDSTLSDMGSNKLRHSPLSKMDMEAGISLFLPRRIYRHRTHGLTQLVQVVLSR
jgi:hypothetical protein